MDKTVTTGELIAMAFAVMVGILFLAWTLESRYKKHEDE